jgi:hypothetical protein
MFERLWLFATQARLGWRFDDAEKLLSRLRRSDDEIHNEFGAMWQITALSGLARAGSDCQRLP